VVSSVYFRCSAFPAMLCYNCKTMEDKALKVGLIGGHLTPALAVADELKKRDTEIFWIGVKHSQTSDFQLSAEYEAVTKRKIPFIPFKAGKLWRRWTPATFFKGVKNLALIPLGSINAYRILFRQRPDVLVSFGGYTALPLLMAAKALRIPTATHEQTTTIGLSNKLLIRIADRVYISWEETRALTPSGKTLLTGNPLRSEVLETRTKQFIFANDLPVVFVTGGNQGANTFNWRLRHVIGDILQHANVIHQTGSSELTKDYEQALAVRDTLPKHIRNRYVVRDRIFGNEIGEAFEKADLVVSRSGANTITELLALGKPAVLIPIPWSSGNEQHRNAELVAATGLATILVQYDAMPPEELRDAILTALRRVTEGNAFNGKPLEQVRKTAAGLVNRDATKLLVDDLLAQFS